MPDTLKIVYEEARKGTYVHLYVNDRFADSRPLNASDQPLKPGDIGGAVAAVARALGAEVVVESTQILYDGRGNEVEKRTLS
jgi:hypothetical protein